MLKNEELKNITYVLLTEEELERVKNHSFQIGTASNYKDTLHQSILTQSIKEKGKLRYIETKKNRI